MKSIYLFFGLLIGYCGFCQSVSPEVIASSGEHFTSVNVELSWTIGETIIETYDSGSNQLTQGFHQPDLIVTALEDLAESIKLHVFPNPTPGLVNVEYSNFSGQLDLLLFDMTGRQLFIRKAISEEAPTTIDLSKFAAGSYFLHVLDPHSQTVKTFKILKIN